MHLFLKTFYSCCLLIAIAKSATAQDSYRYTVDLTRVDNDQLNVELLVPALSGASTDFYFPRIVPGTYMNSNYGRFVQDLKAFDRSGKAIAVKRTDDNSWKISKASSLHKITYKVEDSWDSKLDKKPYSMAGTSFEEGKNFVLNTCGIFGYFEEKRNLPFDLSFTKPTGFYAATGLVPSETTNTSDRFRAANTDELYDSPIMFSLPDTTSLKVGETDVLIAVYSPKKLMTSAYLAQGLSKLLQATKNYLGGKLPVKKYAFIYYFNGEQARLTSAGAWEHSYSSFYSMPELPVEQLGQTMIDISSHEFFHIVTPLTISSREIKEFNFNKTVLSRHLWLYEGSTEYDSHYVQVWSGLITADDFLKRLEDKIFSSRTQYRDSLSFTDLSLDAAGKYADQYNNVYEKGALISACLDLLLLQQSNGQYALRNLKHDLGVKYGKDKYFMDEDLFNEIEKLSWPAIKAFLLRYVQGNNPIPYEEYFALAGIDYIAKETTNVFTLGAREFGRNDKLEVSLKDESTFDELGQGLGYKPGDVIWKFNGKEISTANFVTERAAYLGGLKEADLIKVTVKRKEADGKEKIVELSTAAKKIPRTREHTLRWMSNPSPEQTALKNKWLNGCK